MGFVEYMAWFLSHIVLWSAACYNHGVPFPVALAGSWVIGVYMARAHLAMARAGVARD